MSKKMKMEVITPYLVAMSVEYMPERVSAKCERDGKNIENLIVIWDNEHKLLVLNECCLAN